MPISAEQWRSVTGSNNVRRPKQVGIKLHFMKTSESTENEGGCDQPVKNSGERKAGRRVKKRSHKKHTLPGPENGRLTSRSVLFFFLFKIPLFVIFFTLLLMLTLWGLELMDPCISGIGVFWRYVQVFCSW